MGLPPRDPGSLPAGLEHMQRLAFDLSGVADRVATLERASTRIEAFTNGITGEALVSNGNGTASWNPVAQGTMVAQSYLTSDVSGAGDILSVTIVDPLHDVYLPFSGVFRTSGAAGTNLYIRIFDGAGATGSYYGTAYAFTPAPSYNIQLAGTTVKAARWSGSKTFYMNLANAAGTPSAYSTASAAITVLQAIYC